MTYDTTYPKFSYRSHVDFEIQQILVLPYSIFHAKTIKQKHGQSLQKLQFFSQGT
jgi:hypothetical protein